MFVLIIFILCFVLIHRSPYWLPRSKMGILFASRNDLQINGKTKYVSLMFLHTWSMWKIARWAPTSGCLMRLLGTGSELANFKLFYCLAWGYLSKHLGWTLFILELLFVSFSNSWLYATLWSLFFLFGCEEQHSFNHLLVPLQVVHVRALERPREDAFCLELWVRLYGHHIDHWGL